MRARSIVLLLTVSAFAIPTASFACDMEGEYARFSPFAHAAANVTQSTPQSGNADQAPMPVSYKDDSRDPKTAEPVPVDYNAPTNAPSLNDAGPSDEAVTR